jgi:hypothetical protein
MKAIIISDSDARALLDQLELGKMSIHHWPMKSQLPQAEVDDCHRAFHSIVTRWLQEMGGRRSSSMTVLANMRAAKFGG